MNANQLKKCVKFVRKDYVIVSEWTDEFPEKFRHYGMDFTYAIDRNEYEVCIYKDTKVLVRHAHKGEFSTLVEASIERLAIMISKEEKIDLDKLQKEQTHSEEISIMLAKANDVVMGEIEDEQDEEIASSDRERGRVP